MLNLKDYFLIFLYFCDKKLLLNFVLFLFVGFYDVDAAVKREKAFVISKAN